MKSIKDINFASKKVLLRVDFNVPVDDNKNITDDTRMRESMPTIKKLLDDGAAIIIMAHFGRPKKGGFEPEFTLAPVAKHLEELTGRTVHFTQALLGSGEPEAMAAALKGGEIMLLENIRFYPGETKAIDVIYRLSDYSMEYFTLKTHPITRETWAVGSAQREPKGYRITDACNGCATCQSVCPQNVIAEGSPFVIDEAHCLQCGSCCENCPVEAIEWLGR